MDVGKLEPQKRFTKLPGAIFKLPKVKYRDVFINPLTPTLSLIFLKSLEIINSFEDSVSTGFALSANAIYF